MLPWRNSESMGCKKRFSDEIREATARRDEAYRKALYTDTLCTETLYTEQN